MKICIISHSYGIGGAEKVLLETVDALKERGIECCVIVPSHGSLINELRNRKVAFDVIPYRWWMSKPPLTWKRIVKTVLNIVITVIIVAVRIKQWRCDVVYTNTITVCVGALAARLLGLPHIWHIHEFGYEDHGLVFVLGPKLSSVCIANSNAVAKKYQQCITPSKLRVVYYPMSLARRVASEEAPIPAEPDKGIRCVIVGTLQEGKRQKDAILAIGELACKGIKAELTIVGDGDPKYRKHLYDLVAKYKLDKYVKFVGYMEDPFQFVRSADVVLMCSICEAFGRVTVEAMLARKPVIGARSGGTTELILDGFNGLLYTPRDYKEQAGKIKYLYENPSIAQRMGEDGWKWATERFTQDRYGREVLTILKSVYRQRKDSKA